MPFIEAPTTFYLGRRYDPAAARVADEVVYYDSRDLTTHAVVVGMTGSGKTGLCITLLEEAILDNIPAIIIDPKGDITNLLLTFPELRPQDFLHWVNSDDAARAKMDVESYAADVAHRWGEGLASWGIVKDRIRWLKLATQYSIYTPGSDTGLPISILASLRAPKNWSEFEEENRERINGIVTALLALVGRDAQPLQDKEHVLVANIFEHAWRQGIDLTLESIILQVQKPPFTKLGVFNIDEYISERSRQKLAMDLNSIVAAPSFQSWINGDPMDIHSLLYRPDGRPRISIFYTAHLSEVERQFVTTLLLENTLGWMRTLSGTTSLRALLYIDEMFGYFPPYPRNPPTKEPILRLLKQARAFGLGLILATQNPGDLDYKGLSNAGTWFIGRLQSENDKQKVMTGLESLASMNSTLNLRDVDRLISDLPARVFLMHNVHERSGPVLLHTRWSMSYLRGPLTRDQVKILMAEQRAKMLASRPARNPNSEPPVMSGSTPLPESMGARNATFGAQSAFYAQQQVAVRDVPPSLPEDFPEIETASAPIMPTDSRPIAPSHPSTARGIASGYPGYTTISPPVPSSVTQYFLPAVLNNQSALAQWQQRTGFMAQGAPSTMLAYQPVLLAQVSLRYQDRKTQTFTSRYFAYHIPDLERNGLIHWEEYLATSVDPRSILSAPVDGAIYGELPAGLSDSKRLTAVRRELVDMLYTTARLQIPYNSQLDMYGDPNTDISHFIAQVQQAARERRDVEFEKLTRKFEGVLDKLDMDMQKHTQRLESEKRELANTKREELFTTGEAVLGLLKGRTAFTLSRMSRAAVYKQRSKGQAQMHELEIDQIGREQERVQQEFQTEVQALNEKWARVASQVEDYYITPYKKDIVVEMFGIGWLPNWLLNMNGQIALLPAYEGAS